VQGMQAAGSAAVIMGNHELNAIGYATRGGDGRWLRRHSRKNAAQHAAFLAQIGWDTPGHREAVEWFRSLPVTVDLGGIRVCHAWWDDRLIAAARAGSDANGRLSEDYLRASFGKGSAAYTTLEGLTKGLEAELPDGASFVDHGGVERREVRVRWWDEDATTFREAAIVPEAQRARVPHIALPPGALPGNPSPVPVFVGHYWFNGTPAPQNANTAVLDYGAAIKGPLVAYRWSGEDVLSNDRLVWVG